VDCGGLAAKRKAPGGDSAGASFGGGFGEVDEVPIPDYRITTSAFSFCKHPKYHVVDSKGENKFIFL
jgi:hypothetical protein